MAKRNFDDADGLPLLGDPRIRVVLTRNKDGAPQLRHFFKGDPVKRQTLSEAQGAVLAELLRAAKRANPKFPEDGFVQGKDLAARVWANSKIALNRPHQVIHELRDLLTKPLLDQGLIREKRPKSPRRGRKQPAPPKKLARKQRLRDRILEHVPRLGYRFGLPVANFTLSYRVRRHSPHRIQPPHHLDATRGWDKVEGVVREKLSPQ